MPNVCVISTTKLGLFWCNFVRLSWINLQQINVNVLHLIWIVSLHYSLKLGSLFVKFQCQKLIVNKFLLVTIIVAKRCCCINQIKCSKFHTFTNWWHFAQNHATHQSSDTSVYPRHELGKPAAAFLPICVINDTGDKWRKGLCVGIRLKVWNFEL